MKTNIEEIYKEIKEYGVRILDSEEQYIKKSLMQAYLAGRIAGLEEVIKTQNKGGGK